ncbi:hypothetical protein D3C79_841060 [compost metagenome]
MLVQLTDDPAAVVDLDLFVAGFTVQGVFVITLDTQLADIVSGGVVRQLAVFVQPFDVAIVDLRDIAGDMGEGGAIRIIAALVAFHFHSGEAELIDRKAGDLHFVQRGFHRDGNETA